MRRLFSLVLLALLPCLSNAQAGADAATKNAAKAHAVLDQAIQALGGDAWLKLVVQTRDGRAAAFHHGVPEPGTTLFYEFHAWPDHDRIELTKHRDVVEIFDGKKLWEITYKGKIEVPKDQLDEFLRRREHSIETALKVWLKDPQTILVYEGQHMAARHLADQVTLISPQNEAVTILFDTQTHLPLKRSFEWRDPVYKDKNLEAEEYDDYHVIDGLPTPFTITRSKNGEMVSQRFFTRVSFNQKLDEAVWDANLAEQKIKKR